MRKIVDAWKITLDIAVIGSGMAGLATARILKDAGHTSPFLKRCQDAEWIVIVLSLKAV